MKVSRGSHIDLSPMVERLVRKFHPQCVILFGSHARGDCTSDSDVDLFVIMPFRGSKRQMTARILGVLGGDGIPKDIILSQPSEFAWRKDVVGTIEWPVAREGKVLYGHP